MRALRTVTLLIVLAATSTARADAKQETPLSAAHAEQLLVFFNELVDESVKNASNCEALASAVDALVTRRINTVNMMWMMKKLKQTVPREVQEKMDRRAQEMVNALRKCWNDERVIAAFKRMQPPKQKDE